MIFLKGISKFEVITDHRPLIGIFAKSLPQIDNARITRLREKVSDRPFEVRWLAGKVNVIADALSRAPASTTEGSTSLPVNSCVIASQSTIPQPLSGPQKFNANTRNIFCIDRSRSAAPPVSPSSKKQELRPFN